MILKRVTGKRNGYSSFSTTTTIFAVVPSMEIVEQLVAATEQIVGDLSQPNTGVLFAVPVAAAWGLPKQPFGLAQDTSFDTPAKEQ